jgi:hypothetical protein
MKIGGEGIENLLMNMVLKKKLKNTYLLKKNLSMPFYLGIK